MKGMIPLFLLVVAMASCGDGSQRGRYAHSGTASLPVDPDALLDILSGIPAGASGSPRTLVYVLILLPKSFGQVKKGSNETDSGTYTSSVTHWWEFKDGVTRRVAYTWNREDHTMTVGNSVFRLDASNVLVMTLDESWNTTVFQGTSVLPGIPSASGEELSKGKEILAEIKLQFPDNERIRKTEPK